MERTSSSVQSPPQTASVGLGVADSRICFLVFIDAPHVLSPVDLAEAFRSTSETSSLDDLGAQEASTDSDPALAPRGWWKVDAARTKTIGLEDSILQLRDILAKDHYDGIFGFRQG